MKQCPSYCPHNINRSFLKWISYQLQQNCCAFCQKSWYGPNSFNCIPYLIRNWALSFSTNIQASAENTVRGKVRHTTEYPFFRVIFGRWYVEKKYYVLTETTYPTRYSNSLAWVSRTLIKIILWQFCNFASGQIVTNSLKIIE